MKNLDKLRRLMLENGMLRSQGNSAASFEIIPFGSELFDPPGELRGSAPPDPTPEGGGCIGCTPGGCSPGCRAGCKSGCSEGCEIGCSSGTS